MPSLYEAGTFSVEHCVDQLAQRGMTVEAVYGGRSDSLALDVKFPEGNLEANAHLRWVLGMRFSTVKAGPFGESLTHVLMAYEARDVALTLKAYCADPQHPFFDYVLVVRSSEAVFKDAASLLAGLFDVPVAFATGESAPWVAPQDLSFLRGIPLTDWALRSKVRRLKFWHCNARDAQGLLVLLNKDLILLPGSLMTTRDPNPSFIRPMRQVFEQAVNAHYLDKAHGTWCVQVPLRVVDKALAASLLIQGLGRVDQWVETQLEDIPMSLYERVEQAVKTVRALKGPGSLKDEEIPSFFKHPGR